MHLTEIIDAYPVCTRPWQKNKLEKYWRERLFLTLHDNALLWVFTRWRLYRFWFPWPISGVMGEHRKWYFPAWHASRLSVYLFRCLLPLAPGPDGRKILPCERKCRNEHEQCEMWALRGECSATSDYMLRYCRKACNTCCAAASYRSRTRGSHGSHHQQGTSNEPAPDCEEKAPYVWPDERDSPWTRQQDL